jgi:RHS repeat-associated protein
MHLSYDSDRGTATVVQENGSQVTFQLYNGRWVAGERVFSTLERDANQNWVFMRKVREKFVFEPSGQLSAIADLNGYTTSLARSAGQVTVTDATGRTLQLSLNGDGHVTSAQSGSRTLQYGYDTEGNLTSVTDVRGGVTTFTYDGSHRMLTLRKPNYANDTTTTPTPVLTNTYDSDGRVVRQTDELGRTTTLDYTSIANSTKITDPKGNVEVDEYQNGVRVSVTRGYGTSAESKSKLRYDPDTLALVSQCDALGHCERYGYDTRGNLKVKVDALGNATRMTYNASNSLIQMTDARGAATFYTYDDNQNLLSKIEPLPDTTGSGVTTRYERSDARHPDDMTAIVDPRGNQWAYEYDSHGYMTSMTAPTTAENPAGNKTTFTYDADTGFRLTKTQPKGNLAGADPARYTTTFSYDAAGNLTSTRDPLWSSATPQQHQHARRYDANGNLVSETDGRGQTTTYVYDPANQLTETIRNDRTSTRQTFYTDGMLRATMDGLGRATTYDYDALSRPISVTDSLNRVTTYTYDTAGRLTSKTGPGGTCAGTSPVSCAQYTYDADDRVTGITYPGSTTPAASGIQYDAVGHRVAATVGTERYAWSWDNLGRLTSSTDGASNAIGRAYDLAGNLTELTYPGANRVTRTFDAANRMTSLQDWRSNTTRFSYDANSNLVGTELPSGTGVIDTMSYSDTDALSAASSRKGTTTLASFSYIRDGKDELASSTTSGITEPSQTFTYTARGQLASSGATSSPTTYRYDAADSLTARGSSSTLAYDAAGELCWSAPSVVASPTCGAPPSTAVRYSYDARGNRTTLTPVRGSATTYRYDGADRMSAFNSITYGYDADGLRVTKTNGRTVERFVWDGSTRDAILLKDATNSYIYGPDGLPIEQISTTGVVTFLHHDQLGSTRLLTSATGTNVGTYTFDAYGTRTAITGSVTTPLGYAGQYTDAESGFIYMRARFYDPATGEFMTRDPLGWAASGQNLYGYVFGNPVNGVDPSGLFLSEIGNAVGGALEAGANAIGDAGGWAMNHTQQIANGIGMLAPVACVATIAYCAPALAVAAAAQAAAAAMSYHDTGDLGGAALHYAENLALDGLAAVPGCSGVLAWGGRDAALAVQRAITGAPWYGRGMAQLSFQSPSIGSNGVQLYNNW